MGRKQFIIKPLIKYYLILILLGFVPLICLGQNYPRFELYQLKQGQDSGLFVTTGIDSNLDFNSILRFRFQDSTLLIGTDTVALKSDIDSILFNLIDAGLGIDVNVVDGRIIIESLSIEDSIKNQTGILIEKGTPLYATGVQGNYWTVAPADASDTSKMPVVVIAGEDIDDGETSLGLIKGHIKQVNTTGLADGSEVYVASGGGYTSTKPTAEGIIVQRLGTVIKGNTTNGSGIINLGDEGLWNDYTSLTKLRDTLVLVRNSITTQIGDSLTNYATRTELSDSLTNYATRTELSDSLTNYATRTELSDSLTNYATRTELGDTAFSIRNQTITLSGDATGSGTTAINVTVVDDSHNHIISNVDGLQTALDSKLETEVDGSVTNEGSLTVTAGNESTSVISSNTSGSTDVTLTAGSNITLSESGNNITIAASGGGSSLWSEGATAGEIYYNSGNVGIGLTDPEFPLHVSGRGYFTDDLRAFDRIYLGGDFNHTSGSYAPYIDRYAATGETSMDFYAYNSGANLPLFRFFDSYDSYSEVFRLNSAASTFQIIANGKFNIEGNLTQTGSIVHDGGTVTFNNTQGNYDFGVGSTNYLPFMWVDASADKMAVGGGTPAYTLDVTGDINFTGDLYDNGVLFSGGGSEEYVFNIIVRASNSPMYLNFPTTVYGCTIDEIGMVISVINCTSCSFDYNLGTISGGSFGTNVDLWNPAFTTGTGEDFSTQTFSQSISSTNNIIQVLNTNSITIPNFNASVIVSCN